MMEEGNMIKWSYEPQMDFKRDRFSLRTLIARGFVHLQLHFYADILLLQFGSMQIKIHFIVSLKLLESTAKLAAL